MEKLGGLIHRMPVTTGCALVGAACLAGLPVFAGFARWIVATCRDAGVTKIHGLMREGERFEQIEFNKDTYEYRAFTRLKQIRYLSRTGQIDQDFFWR